jgi:ribosomal protein S18 acetylase RimI-like enzyme
MLASNNIALETLGEKNSTSPPKKHKRHKRTLRPADSNGVMENGNDSLIESTPTRAPKSSQFKKIDESSLETSPYSQSTDRNTYQLTQTLTPVKSLESNPAVIPHTQKFQQVELRSITDEEEYDDRIQKGIDIQPTDRIITDRDSTMVSSYTTGGDNDVIEIHEFSFADIDAYLDIYFETLNNRLRHFIGEDNQLQQFRNGMKTRINSDHNSREYRNVLLGKMNGEVVAAVTLTFPSETTTVLNNNILQQSSSCFTSVRRWMIRNANYIPANMEECYIEMIGVKSAYRNHGIGAAMLECVEHFARQAGALLLTVHTNSDQLKNYFERFGFNIDHSDSSALWKWMVERESINKMSKTISPNDGNNDYPMDSTGSYINESMIGSEVE